MGKDFNGIRRYQLILGILFAVALAVYTLVIHNYGIESEVAKIYLPYANDLMDGTIPDMEYPPFAMVFLFIPRLFASSPLGYDIAFLVEVFIFFMLGLFAMARIAKRYSQSQRKVMLVYTILMLLMLEFVVDRYDVFPAVLTLLALYCFTTKKYVWAFALLSIATMTKLYPAVLFPVFLIPLMLNRDWRSALKGAVSFFVIAGLIVLPFFLMHSDAVSYFLGYHMDRPLQVESTAASFIALLSIFGLTDVWIQFDFGSDNLMGSLPDSAASVMTPLTLVVLVLIYAMYAYMLSRLQRDSQDNENNRMVLFSVAVLLSVLAFVVFGKVLSSQYLVWIIPFVAIMMMVAIDHASKRRIFSMSVIAIALTQLDFAFNIGLHGGGSGITDMGMMIILVRNIVLLILFIYVIKMTAETVKKRPLREPAPDL